MIKQEEIREGIARTIRETIRKSTFESAGEIVKYLHSKGVVIKVDRELPRPKHVTDETWEWMNDFLIRIREDFIKAGYVAVESLIKD